jgi:putative transposase
VAVSHHDTTPLTNEKLVHHLRGRNPERAMKRCTFPGHAQRFLSAFSGISPHFRPRRHRLSANAYRREITSRFATWNEVVGFPTAS